MNPVAWINAWINAWAVRVTSDEHHRPEREDRRQRQADQARESDDLLRQLRAELRLMRRWKAEGRGGHLGG